jgi:hypothetical protein
MSTAQEAGRVYALLADGTTARALILIRLWVSTPSRTRSPLVPAVQQGAVPAVAAFEVADPAFAARAPLDQLAEAAAVPGGLADGDVGSLAENRHGSDVQVLQVTLDGGLAVAAVGGDRGENGQSCSAASMIRAMIATASTG